MNRVAVLDTGQVGQTPAKGFQKHRFKVSLGSRGNICIIWCIPGMLRNDWTHAFKLLR